MIFVYMITIHSSKIFCWENDIIMEVCNLFDIFNSHFMHNLQINNAFKAFVNLLEVVIILSSTVEPFYHLGPATLT